MNRIVISKNPSKALGGWGSLLTAGAAIYGATGSKGGNKNLGRIKFK